MTMAPETVTPSGAVVLADGRTFYPGSGGAGSPELAYIDPESGGRRYIDPLPWCPMLGKLGIEAEGYHSPAEFVSVTTKLGNLPTHRLLPWYSRMTAECAARTSAPPCNLLEQFGPEIMIAYWRGAPERVRDEAGERGTLVHDIAEDGKAIVPEDPRKVVHFVVDDLLAGRNVDPWFVERANCAPYIRGLVKFFAAHPGIVAIWSEVTVFSRRYGIGGTLDLIAWVPGIGWCLIDWKSSNTVQPKFSFQCAAYRFAEYGILDGIRVPVPPVDGMYVVHIQPGDPDPQTGWQDGAWEMYPLDNDPGQLEIYDAMTAVGRWDHPSRIGKPLPHPDLAGLASDQYAQGRPPMTVVTPAEAALLHVHPETMASIVDGVAVPFEPERFAVQLEDPEVRVNRAHEAFLAAERAWFADGIAWLQTKAQTDVEAAYVANELLAYWVQSGVPRFDDALFGIDETVQPQYEELLHRLTQACDRTEMPFSPRPEAQDWDGMLEAFKAESAAAVAAPAKTMQDLGHLLVAAQTGALDPEHRVVTLGRRSMSVSADSWGEPANPSLVEACTELADRVSKLPPDLIAELDDWKRESGVPNLRTISMRPEHLAAIEARVDVMKERWHARVAAAVADVTAVTGSDSYSDAMDFVEMLLDLCSPERAQTLEECTGQSIELIRSLCRGVTRLDLALGVDDQGKLRLTPAVSELDLIARYGTKTNVRKAAREAAERIGARPVKSSAEVAQSIVLIAAMGDDMAAFEAAAKDDAEYTEAVLG